MSEEKKHVCGLCAKGFDTDKEYCEHVCEETGVTPADPEHQGPEFAAISEEALKRGEARKGEETHPSEK